MRDFASVVVINRPQESCARAKGLEKLGQNSSAKFLMDVKTRK